MRFTLIIAILLGDMIYYSNYYFFCSICFLVIALATSITASGQIVADEGKEENFWNTLSEKPVPLYQCEGIHGGNKVTMPSPPDCDIPVKVDSNIIVRASLYLPDVRKQVVKAWECWEVITAGILSRSFLNKKTSDTRSITSNATQDDCWEMVKNMRTPGNLTLSNHGNGIFGTNEELAIESEWNNDVYGVVTNYFFREIEVSVFDLDDSILASTDIKRRCYYKDAKCFSKLGIIVWQPDNFRKCRLVEVGETACVFSKLRNYTRLSCEDLQISLHDISEVDMCGHTFGYTRQGYFLTQHNGGDISENVSLAKHVSKIITRPRRAKGDVEEISQVDPIDS